jgi:SAM-dependent methyltransferase
MTHPREYIVAALRATRLLPAYNAAKFHYVVAKARAGNEAFVREHPDFPLPPLPLCYDAYAHVGYRDYFESGRNHAEFFGGKIAQHAQGAATFLSPESGSLAVLEWGCGPARVIRHLGDFLRGEPSLAGSDYNPETIAWCRANIPGIRFEKNELAPPLPFPGGSFDAVYALSVLTHLSEAMHFAWRDELKRVLRPGGILIVTAHGDWYRKHHLRPDEQKAYDAGRLVVRGGVEEGKKWFAAFHPPVFMREKLFAGWKVLEHLTHPLPGSIEQDVWIVRRA